MLPEEQNSSHRGLGGRRQCHTFSHPHATLIKFEMWDMTFFRSLMTHGLDINIKLHFHVQSTRVPGFLSPSFLQSGFQEIQTMVVVQTKCAHDESMNRDIIPLTGTGRVQCPCLQAVQRKHSTYSIQIFIFMFEQTQVVTCIKIFFNAQP